jgi:rod shape-determining protein MreD
MARIDQAPGIRPRPTIGRRLDIISRHAFPASSTILLMLLTEMPTGIRGQTTLLPAVTLACVWFWSVFRPSAMSPPVVFVIGLLLDLLGYQPLGVGVFILLVAHAVALRCRHSLAPRGFALLWLVFAAVSAVDAALTWLLTVLLTWRLIAPTPAVFQAALTAALYPALAIPLARAHRSIADPERA